MNRKFTMVAGIALVALAAAIAMAWPRGQINWALDAFAQCLESAGAVMYGADWCPHCQSEKKAFGSSFRFIPYVECPENPGRCLAAGVNGYPTWIFPGGRRLEGEQELERLSAAANCPLP